MEGSRPRDPDRGGTCRPASKAEHREIKKITKSKPTEHDLPFSTWI
ncbi:hypothetical protein [[Kitasatospora] papulosa]